MRHCYRKGWSYRVGARKVEAAGEALLGAVLQTWGKPWEEQNQSGRKPEREMIMAGQWIGRKTKIG